MKTTEWEAFLEVFRQAISEWSDVKHPDPITHDAEENTAVCEGLEWGLEWGLGECSE